MSTESFEPLFSLHVDVVGVGVERGCHHSASFVGTRRNSRQLVVGVEDDLARGPRLRSIVDDQLQNDVESGLNGTVGQVLALAGASCSVAGHPGAWVAPITSQPRRKIVLTRIKTVILRSYE